MALHYIRFGILLFVMLLFGILILFVSFLMTYWRSLSLRFMARGASRTARWRAPRTAQRLASRRSRKMAYRMARRRELLRGQSELLRVRGATPTSDESAHRANPSQETNRRNRKTKGQGNLRLRGGGAVNSKMASDDSLDSHSSDNATLAGSDGTASSMDEDVAMESMEERHVHWVDTLCNEVESSFMEEVKIRCKTDRETNAGPSGSGVVSNARSQDEEGDAINMQDFHVEDLGVEDMHKARPASPTVGVWEEHSHLLHADVESCEKESRRTQDTQVQGRGVEAKGQKPPEKSESGELIVRRPGAKKVTRRVGNGTVEVWVGCGGSLGESVSVTNAWNDGQDTKVDDDQAVEEADNQAVKGG